MTANDTPPAGDFMRELDELRARIDAIDARVISLLAERRREVARVVAIKKEHNLPVYHPAREEDLISDRRAMGERAGLSAAYVEDLYRCILRASRISQTEQIARKGVRSGAVVVIVGGGGAMGSYLGRWFAEAGYQVRSIEPADWPRVDALCAGADLALVSVPIERTEAVIARLAPHLPPQCVLADVTSIKASPLAAMLAAHPGPVVGLHPVFGPATASMDKQLVVMTPGRGGEACRWVLDQFASWGCVVVPADPAQHDESMAIIQALRHFTTFAFGQFLCSQRVDLHRTLDHSSPIYRLELGMVGRLFAQEPSLYAQIIFSLPERRNLLKQYIRSMNANLAMLEHGDTEAFCAEFRRIAAWFGSFSDQALRESSYLIEKLIERF